MIINMVNFIDGLDGLAAGVCGISALTFCDHLAGDELPGDGRPRRRARRRHVRLPALQLPPGSIFMGDAGSMLLGFVLACISVQSVMKGTAAVALVLPLLVLGVPFVDLFLIVWRRWRRGVPFYSRRAGPRAPRPRARARLLAAQERAAAVLLVHPAQRPRHRHAAAASGRRSSCSAIAAVVRDGLHGAAAQPLPLAPPRPARSAGPGCRQQPHQNGAGMTGSLSRACTRSRRRSCTGAKMVSESHLQAPRHGRYSVTPEHPEDGKTKDPQRSSRRRPSRSRSCCSPASPSGSASAPASTGSSAPFPCSR